MSWVQRSVDFYRFQQNSMFNREEGNMDKGCDAATARKPIDWTKPLRIAGPQMSAAVRNTRDGNRHIVWRDDCCKDNHAFVSATGYLVATLHAGVAASVYQFVENVPEEPRDHIVVAMVCGQGPWKVDNECGGQQLFTKERAESIARELSRGIAVKVGA